jgi:hypothetical protein
LKSVVEIDINIPQQKLAELFCDPARSTEWMHDLEKIESIEGTLGKPGSTYRMVPKKGNLVFVAKVISVQLPAEARIFLDSPMVTVAITAKFIALSENTSRLVSEEIFTFKRVFGMFFGFFAQRAIKGAHRKHMESFKRFAESLGSGSKW